MTLKVKDLIEELKKHDPEMDVVDRYVFHRKATGVEIKNFVELVSGGLSDESDYNYLKGHINLKGGATRFKNKYGFNVPKPMLVIR